MNINLTIKDKKMTKLKNKIVKGFLLATLMLGGVSLYAAQFPQSSSVIALQVGIDNPTLGHGGHPRTPINPPAVSIDDHTLYTDAVWFDATLQVLDEDENVVYTTVVPAGTPTVVLPSSLSGDYELRLIQGYWYFYGEISL